MNIFTANIILLVAASISALSQTISLCTDPRIRREWRELSTEQKNNYIAAVQSLVARPEANSSSDPSITSYADLVRTHMQNAFWVHNAAPFYPYHRAMMHFWDLMLQSVGYLDGPPYWDWTTDVDEFYESDVWNYFGSPGSPIEASDNPNNCLRDGPFAADKFKVAPYPPFHEGPQQRDVLLNDASDPFAKTCLRRCKMGKITPYSREAIIETLLNAKDFAVFQAETGTHGVHNALHAFIGGSYENGTTCGDMSNAGYSTNDPLFFLHHGMIDKLWYTWQNLCPSYKESYDGYMNMNFNNGEKLLDEFDTTSVNMANEFDPSGIPHRFQPLHSWPFTVEDMMDTMKGPLCYTYSTSHFDTEPVKSPTCPDVDASTNWILDLVASMSGIHSSSPSNTVSDSTKATAALSDSPAVLSSTPEQSEYRKMTRQSFHEKLTAELIHENDLWIDIDPKTHGIVYHWTDNVTVAPAYGEPNPYGLIRYPTPLTEGQIRAYRMDLKLQRTREAVMRQVVDRENAKKINKL